MDLVLFNFHDVVLLMTTYQCTLFALLLVFLRREPHSSNLLLAGFLVTQAAIPLDILINYGAAFRAWALQISPDLFRIFGLAYWLEGALLLWYTRSLIYRNYRLRRSDLICLLPLLCYALYQYAVFFRLDEAGKLRELSQSDVLAEPLITHLIGFTRECLRVVFGLLCVIEIRRCRRRMRDTYSNIDAIDFSWLNILILGFLALRIWAIGVSVGIVLASHVDLKILDFASMGLAANYTAFIFVSAMIFLSLTYSSMFEGIEHRSEPAPEAEQRAEIDPAQVERLVAHMDSEKPYLATILTVEQLAKQLSLPKRALSNIINRHFQQNFFEFINGYRVEEAKRLLRDESWQGRTVTEVMTASGFNSKATFNTFFKKCVGTTPSQFRRSQ